MAGGGGVVVGHGFLPAPAPGDGEGMHAVDGDVQVFAEPAQRERGRLEVVVELEAVLAFGCLGRLGCRFEEVFEAGEESLGRLQDLIEEAGGFVVRAGGIQLVGEITYGIGCPVLDGRGVGLGWQVGFSGFSSGRVMMLRSPPWPTRTWLLPGRRWSRRRVVGFAGLLGECVEVRGRVVVGAQDLQVGVGGHGHGGLDPAGGIPQQLGRGAGSGAAVLPAPLRGCGQVVDDRVEEGFGGIQQGVGDRAELGGSLG